MRAVLFGLLSPGGSTSTDEFEGPGCMESARRMRDAVGDDFPDAIWSVAGDDEARRDDAITRTATLVGISSEEAASYIKADA